MKLTLYDTWQSVLSAARCTYREGLATIGRNFEIKNVFDDNIIESSDGSMIGGANTRILCEISML